MFFHATTVPRTRLHITSIVHCLSFYFSWRVVHPPSLSRLSGHRNTSHKIVLCRFFILQAVTWPSCTLSGLKIIRQMFLHINRKSQFVLLCAIPPCRNSLLLQIQAFVRRDRKIGPQKKLHPYFGFEEKKIPTVKWKGRKETSQRNLTDGRKRGRLFVPFSVEKMCRSAKSTLLILYPVFRELEACVLLRRWFTTTLGIK